MPRPRINAAAPLTTAEKAARSQSKLTVAGGRRLNVNLSPEAARALAALIKRHPHETATDIVNRALIAAADRA